MLDTATGIVPVKVDSVWVKLLPVFGEAIVIVPIPLAFPDKATCDILILYTTVQFEPDETVTVTPVATETVPALMAFCPDAIV